MADGNAPLQIRRPSIVEPSVFDIRVLAEDMRPDEVAQWLALTGFKDYDPDRAAKAILATMGPYCFCLIDAEGRPVAAGGFNEAQDGVFEAWMMASLGAWGTHWRAFTKHARRMMDAMFASGRARRIQVHALADRKAAHAWYDRGLGMSHEGTLRRYFADGQDAVIYSRIAP